MSKLKNFKCRFWCMVKDDADSLYKVKEYVTSYKFEGGMSFSQKQKASELIRVGLEMQYNSLLDANADPLDYDSYCIKDSAIDICSYSRDTLGCNASAMKLMLDGLTFESLFQGSKLFADGSDSTDLLRLTGFEAKDKIKGAGDVIGFSYNGDVWDVSPITAFYDYYYLKALKNTMSLDDISELMSFSFFFDSALSKGSKNCQARTLCLLQAFIYNDITFSELTKDEFLYYHKKLVGAPISMK